MDDFQSSMMEIFVFETNSFLEEIENILLETENNDSRIIESVPEIFRVMHTIKSSAAMMGFDSISKVAHSAEDLFSYIRANNPENIDKAKLADVVFECVDYIRKNMDQGTSDDPVEKIKIISAFLEEIKNPKPVAPPDENSPSIENKEKSDAVLSDESSLAIIQLQIVFKPNCQLVGVRAFEVYNNVLKASQKVTSYPDLDDERADTMISENGVFFEVVTPKAPDDIVNIVKKSPFVEKVEILEIISEQQPEKEAEAKTEPEAQKAPAPYTGPDRRKNRSSDSSEYQERRTDSPAFINVPVKKLDNMVDLAGELSIAEMELKSAYFNNDIIEIEKTFEALDKMIMQVHEAALSVRMISVQETFHKLTRIVRDITRKQNKDVLFVTSGEDTEVDKNIIDTLFSPLMHMVRNSIDHGIESSEERQLTGKPPQGVVTLSAVIEGNNIIMTLTDDGKGFDRKKIIEKSISLGLITPEQSEKMSEDDINALVFLPGFSTNQEITEFSGRGVGMDVVNDSLRKMNGKITVKSKYGEGTTITLVIPQSLSIIETLILKSDDEICALPLNSVKEVFKFDEGSVKNVNGRDVILYKEQCYNIISMSDFFDTEKKAYSDGLMILIKSSIESFVIFTDTIISQQNVVVKPVPKLLRNIRGIYGCTVLSDGRITMIIDPDKFSKG